MAAQAPIHTHRPLIAGSTIARDPASEGSRAGAQGVPAFDSDWNEPGREDPVLSSREKMSVISTRDY